MESKKQTKKQNKIKLTGTENKLVAARGDGGSRVGKMGEGGQEVQNFRYRINKSWDVMYSVVNIVNNIVLHI